MTDILGSFQFTSRTFKWAMYKRTSNFNDNIENMPTNDSWTFTFFIRGKMTTLKIKAVEIQNENHRIAYSNWTSQTGTARVWNEQLIFFLFWNWKNVFAKNRFLRILTTVRLGIRLWVVLIIQFRKIIQINRKLVLWVSVEYFGELLALLNYYTDILQTYNSHLIRVAWNAFRYNTSSYLHADKG